MAHVAYFPEHEVDGIKGWYWIETDRQTFGFIKQDWEQTHKEMLFRYMKQFNKPFGVVVQAGGNLGMYPKILSKYFGAVYTFEPDPANFYALSINCNEQHIFKMQAALDETNRFVQIIHRTQENVGMHQVKPVEPNQLAVPSVMVDQFNFPQVDLLWLDIEGFEMHALMGAVETIKRCRPLVVCENPQAVEDFMKTLDYKMYDQSHMDGFFYLE